MSNIKKIVISFLLIDVKDKSPLSEQNQKYIAKLTLIKNAKTLFSFLSNLLVYQKKRLKRLKPINFLKK